MIIVALTKANKASQERAEQNNLIKTAKSGIYQIKIQPA